ncbi:MAG TPA: redoxin domain-containing protein [Pirellulales bacterium]|nr:redoxin domain-containing protein [Pirellulales bacterium]
MKTWLLCGAVAVVGSFAGLSSAHAQVPSMAWHGLKAAEFPQDPGLWINTAPLRLDDLKGKGVVLWFFSDQCPRCKKKWPELMELSKLFEGQPVLFIGVSSGAPREVLDKYVHETKVTWPILVDTSRKYELESQISPPISLQNICQLRVITSDGHLQLANWEDIPGTAAAARKGATWKVDPNEVPFKLVAAWEGVEFGNYRAAGPLLKAALKSPDAEIKAGAEKLIAAVQPAIDSMVADAKKAEEKGDIWAAYNLYRAIDQKFLDFDIPDSAVEAKKKLAEDPKIRAGLAAQRDLDRAKKLLVSSNPVVRQRAAPILQKIVKDSPDSNAGKEAQKILGGGYRP